MINSTIPPLQGSVIQGLPFLLQDWFRQVRLFLAPTSASVVNQVGNVASTPILKVPSDGMYQLGLYAITTVVGAAGTYNIAFLWTDPAGASGLTVTGNSLTTLNSGTLSIVIQVVAGSIVSFSTTEVGVVGTPKYSLYISLTRMS